ncbi:MAG: YqgE/AlgH family protein [Alphaproteobacteria bacterium]|nr:YqgE/AlgH family protein [Alphaproteobacteria bacterium]
MDKSDGAFLTGKLLLAMPGLSDPRFHRAVILVCAHDENGAMGLVLNHSLPGLPFTRILDSLNLSSDIQVDPAALDIPVICGGPVEPGRGFLLHSAEFSCPDTLKINQDVSVTGTVDTLKDVASGKGPARFLFILGYAGWDSGQLESEIQHNSWLVSEPTPELLFETEDEESKWTKAVQTLGFDPTMLSGDAGRA